MNKYNKFTALLSLCLSIICMYLYSLAVSSVLNFLHITTVIGMNVAGLLSISFPVILYIALKPLTKSVLREQKAEISSRTSSEVEEITNKVEVGEILIPSKDKLIIQCDVCDHVTSYVVIGGITRQTNHRYFEIDINNKALFEDSNYSSTYFVYREGNLYLPTLNIVEYYWKRCTHFLRYKFYYFIKESTFSFVASSFVSYVLMSGIASLISTKIALMVISVDQDKALETAFLDYFIPIFAVVLTLTGVYLHTKSARDAYLKQRSDSVKPDISIRNETVNWNLCSNNRKATIHACIKSERGHGVGHRQAIISSDLVVSNYGLNTARNVIFITESEKGALTLHNSSQIKAVTLDSEEMLIIWIPDIDYNAPFNIYSKCENVYGEAVFHAHMFFGKTNGENLYHLGDRFIETNSREYKKLMRKLFL